MWLVEKEEQDIQYQVLKTIKRLTEDRDITVAEAVDDKLKNLMDQKKTAEELAPEGYHKYLSVFKEKKSECMPTQKA